MLSESVKTRYTFYAERGYLPHCSTLRSLSNSAVVFPGALPLDPAGGYAPDPHSLALRARFSFRPSLNPHAKVGGNRANRFEVMQFFVL